MITDKKRFELLHTERLLLRRPTVEDANAIFSSYPTQKEVTKYLLFPPHESIQDTLNFIQWSDEQWEKKGGYNFILCSKADEGRVIGGVGLYLEGLDDEHESEETKLPAGVARVSYYIAKEQCRKGYATEACKTMIKLAIEVGITKLVAPVHPDNLASIRVLEKCGFQEDAMVCEMLVLPNLGKEKATLVGFGRTLSLSDPPPTLTWED
jgi:[ribosomal protein S5]-alanine N-acetyltransferase